MKDILTLWDIDGTLVNVYKYHTPAYQAAIKHIYGINISASEIEQNYGLPAREVVAIPVRKLGVAEEVIQAGLDKVFSIYAQQLEKGIKTASGDETVVLPGVIRFLEMIRYLDIPRGIVTGNIKQSGEAIIRAANLNQFFDPNINSYADNTTQRKDIVAAAIKKFRENYSVHDEAKIYVLGDTPTDVEAATSNGCISVAVIKNSNEADSSPGGDSYRQRKEIMEKANPDFLIDDFTAIEKFFSRMMID